MIKLKSLIVILLSSILITSVILLTIFGLSLYIGWKEREATKLHEQRLTALNARLYNNFITIHDLHARYESEGIYKGKCLLEGTIKNSGYRTVSLRNSLSVF